jgi:F-type H+-transporting ATPase subunit epsilon
MIVRKDGQDRFLVVGDGFVEITRDRVAILTDFAIAAENIDEAKAEEAHQLAAARLREAMSSEEVAAVNSALVRSLAQLRVRRRQRN